MLDKKEIQKLKRFKGKVRGVVFNTDKKYLLKTKGEEEVKKIGEKMQEIDPDFNFGDLKNTEWYPFYWRILLLLLVKDMYNWEDKDVYEMGRFAPSNSFIVKTILRYFNLFQKTCKESPTYWDKHYSVGKLENIKYDGKNGKAIFHLKDFKYHPIMCTYLVGYWQGMAELVNRGKNNKTREAKCMFKGDDYHELIIEWDGDKD